MNRIVPLLLLVLGGCGSPYPGSTRIIGHGGLGDRHELPMNTEPSLLGALEGGVAGIELDVQLTADSVLVAYHAQDLSELTGCSGIINAHSYAQLIACPLVIADGRQFAIERLDSLLTRAARQHPGKDFTLDCKLFAHGTWWKYLHTYANALVELNRLPEIQSRLIIECQVDDFLLLVQEKQPYLSLFRYAVDADEAIWRAAASHFVGIVVSNDRITASQVEFAHELGLEVTIFGVGDRRGHRSALRKGADRLQSDAPLELIGR